MKYKTELHCHSRTVSICANISPAEIVEMYLACGYHTVMLTEHLSEANFHAEGKYKTGLSASGYPGERYMGSEDWQEKVGFYMSGIEALRKAAAGSGLNVLFGCEIRVTAGPSDYLLYGATEEFFRSYPDLLHTDIKTLSARVHEAGCLFYQAHPFRNNMTITPPKYLDGIEVYNSHPRHDSRNDIAEMWAKRHDLRALSGSDTHNPGVLPGGGIYTDAPIATVDDLMAVLRANDYTLVREGTPGAAARDRD